MTCQLVYFNRLGEQSDPLHDTWRVEICIQVTQCMSIVTACTVYLKPFLDALESGFIQIGDLDKALKGVDKDAFKILLSHDPTHWEEKVRFNTTPIQLTLSGHTHGAQFGIEAAGLRWSPVQHRYLDWAGLAHHNNRYLYVNRGFGFLAFSGRLGIWPEITVITLRKKVA